MKDFEDSSSLFQIEIEKRKITKALSSKNFNLINIFIELVTIFS